MCEETVTSQEISLNFNGTRIKKLYLSVMRMHKKLSHCLCIIVLVLNRFNAVYKLTGGQGIK